MKFKFFEKETENPVSKQEVQQDILGYLRSLASNQRVEIMENDDGSISIHALRGEILGDKLVTVKFDDKLIMIESNMAGFEGDFFKFDRIWNAKIALDKAIKRISFDYSR